MDTNRALQTITTTDEPAFILNGRAVPRFDSMLDVLSSVQVGLDVLKVTALSNADRAQD